MKRATQFFSPDDRKRVTDAVVAAEARTSAEIVPVVATASGRYDRAEDVVGLWLAVVAVLTAWQIVPEPPPAGDFSAGMSVAGKGLIIAVAGVVAFIVGAVLATYVAWLRRLFTPRRQMRDEVLLRAHSLFFDQRIHRTAGATGLLVYVSLFERTAAIVADDAVIRKLGQPAIDGLCAELTSALAAGSPTDALCAAIKAAADRLAPVLPRAAAVNELSDALITID